MPAQVNRDRLAFVALDRREWLTLVAVLDGAYAAIDCYQPIVRYRGIPDKGALRPRRCAASSWVWTGWWWRCTATRA